MNYSYFLNNPHISNFQYNAYPDPTVMFTQVLATHSSNTMGTSRDLKENDSQSRPTEDFCFCKYCCKCICCNIM